MSEATLTGVVFTEWLRAEAFIASIWSFETGSWYSGRPIVGVNAKGHREYWLEHNDPLLNTILPGTHFSVIVNAGAEWASGRSLATSAMVPKVSVMGPVTQSRILRVGSSVRAIGAVIAPMFAQQVFGVPASELIDQVVGLEDLWGSDDAERLLESVSRVDTSRAALCVRQELVRKMLAPSLNTFVATARMIQRRAGRGSIDSIAKQHQLSRQEFARRFRATTGFTPKLFAQLTRFERLVQQLLATEVEEWASLSSASGFYDQAHMINEFRRFAGSAPTRFFRPHPHETASPVRLRGRPSEWVALRK